MVENWCDDERDTTSTFLCRKRGESESEYVFAKSILKHNARVNPRSLMYDEAEYIELYYEEATRVKPKTLSNDESHVAKVASASASLEVNASLLQVDKFAYS